MSDWRPIMDAPSWVTIRARYKNGVETTGRFGQDDRENLWFDDASPAHDDWPDAWMPLPFPPHGADE